MREILDKMKFTYFFYSKFLLTFNIVKFKHVSDKNEFNDSKMFRWYHIARIISIYNKTISIKWVELYILFKKFHLVRYIFT